MKSAEMAGTAKALFYVMKSPTPRQRRTPPFLHHALLVKRHVEYLRQFAVVTVAQAAARERADEFTDSCVQGPEDTSRLVSAWFKDW